jgi:diguanylate cyclase (GGDEF)-like protein/PAS domain S-box-containing protein
MSKNQNEMKRRRGAGGSRGLEVSEAAAGYPQDEAQRLALLSEFSILDTPDEAVYDHVIQLAAACCDTPVAFIGLMDLDRLWFKSAMGMGGMREVPREITFCTHTLLGNRLMEVPDATRDPRFSANPLVTGGPGLRYYAGVPLTSAEGVAIGAVCVMDTRPRKLAPAQRQMLRSLSRVVTALLEARRKDRRQRATLEQLQDQNQRILSAAGDGIYGIDGNGITTFVNDAAARALGYRQAELLGRPMHELIHHSHADGRAYPIHDCPIYLATRNGEAHQVKDEVFWRKDGSALRVEYTSTPIMDENRPNGAVIVFRDVGERLGAEEALRASEARFRALTGLMTDWYWEQDERLRFTLMACNQDEHRLVKTGKCIGKTRFEMDVDWVSDDIREAHRATLAARQPFRDLLLRARWTGDYFLVSGDPVFDGDGVFRGYRGVGREVTENIKARQALVESESRLRGLLALSSDWYWEQDERLCFSRISGAAQRSLPFDPQRLLGCALWDSALLQPVDGDWRRFRQALEKHRAFRDQVLRVRFDETGGDSYMSISGEPVYDASGRFSGYRGTGKDVTAQIVTAGLLRENEARLRAMIDAAPDAVVSIDERGRIVEFNPAAERTFGYARAEVIGRDMQALLIPPDHRGNHGRGLASHSSSEAASILNQRREVPALRKDGSTFPASIAVVCTRSEGATLYTAFLRDISESKAAQQRLLLLAHYDSLTGLPNRVLFYDRLTQLLLQSQRNGWTGALLFIDLDRFKLVNDTLGHHGGDELLRQVALRLQDCLRPGDTVGRLGGDEFALILANIAQPQDAELVAEKLMYAFRKPFEVGGHEIFVTVSVGITVFPGDGVDADLLIRHADAAMYRAKDEGRNAFQFFSGEALVQASGRLSLESSLRRALDRGEFRLHYQPRIDLRSGEIVGLEALLRWQKSDGELVAPGTFVPVLEETGLILPVGDWVMRAACAQIQQWQAAGVACVPVAVNLSPRQLRVRSLADRLGRMLEQHGVEARLLELEITETSLMRDPDEAVRLLAEIRRPGVRIAIDDFGTGYSSLGYLKRFPLDYLKIDRSFVRDVTSDPDDASIVRTIITMAHELGLRVVAEGVETESQLAFLTDHGCEEAQGFLFSRPIDAAAALGLLTGGPMRAPSTLDLPARRRGAGAALAVVGRQ